MNEDQHDAYADIEAVKVPFDVAQCDG
ncbi:unnamed protein product, partial [Rotaria magnacalcarata]